MASDASKSALLTVGDYDLIQKVAEGGMGTVYRGRHRQSGQVVAVKIVPPNMVNNTVLQKRFENEFRAASKLDHPNIVRAMEFGLAGGRAFLVMEFVEGESLGQRLEREGKLAEPEAVRIIALAAKGLFHAHRQGLIHRDVKPDNILLTADGQVKLADLGLVKEMDADINLTRTGRGLGTPHFMAPEQFRNAKNADVRCDVYSLGATLYQMVTGELPFRSLGPLDAWMKKVNNELTPPRKLNPEISERVDTVIRRCMDSDPAKRPENCREFVEDLTGRSTRAPRAPEAQTTPPDLWYLVYRDEEGEMHTVKGTTAGIRRSLKEGLLGDASNVRACRTKSGPFSPLASVPEFKDLVGPAVLKATEPVEVPALPAGGAKTSDPSTRTPTPSAKQPHIPLETSASGISWITVTIVALIAMAFGMVLFFLIFRP